jgi:hypothetical protein
MKGETSGEAKSTIRSLIKPLVIIILMLMSLTFFYDYLFHYGKEGDLEITIELITEPIFTNSSFSMEVTLKNIGKTDLRLPPFHPRTKYIFYPNGSLVRYHGEKSEKVVYGNKDLFILPAGKSVERTITFSPDLYDFDVPGTYKISTSYCRFKFDDIVKFSHWEGCEASDYIEFTVI